MSNIIRSLYRNPTSRLFHDFKEMRKIDKHKRAISLYETFREANRPERGGLTYGLQGTVFNTSPEPKAWIKPRKVLKPHPPVIDGKSAIFSDGKTYKIAYTGQYLYMGRKKAA